MRRTRAIQAPQELVPSWPRVSASVRPDGTGTLTINGTERPVAAGDVMHLRSGVIARAAALAARLRRPVRLTVTEDPATWTLAVRPSGVVQLLTSEDTLPSVAGLHPHHGPCRECGEEQPVTAGTCPACGVQDPHRVDVVLGGPMITELTASTMTRSRTSDTTDLVNGGGDVRNNA